MFKYLAGLNIYFDELILLNKLFIQFLGKNLYLGQFDVNLLAHSNSENILQSFPTLAIKDSNVLIIVFEDDHSKVKLPNDTVS